MCIQCLNLFLELETDSDNKMSYVEILDEAINLSETMSEENIRRVFTFLDKDQIGTCRRINIYIYFVRLLCVGAISCGDIVDILQNEDEDEVLQVCSHFDLTREGQIG